jgi:hypothetical protein
MLALRRADYAPYSRDLCGFDDSDFRNDFLRWGEFFHIVVLDNTEDSYGLHDR